MAMAERSIGRRIADGAIWMVGFRMADRLLGLVSTLVLARLLTPADFGLVAMATAFIAMLELATAFSFDVALIQNRNATRQHYDSAWTMNVLLGIGMGAVIFAAAPFVAAFYRTVEVAGILQLLTLGIVAQGAENIGTVAFRKELDLRREFIFLFTKRLLAVVVALSLAFAWRSYWALVAGMVVGRVAGALFSYMIHPYRPRPDISRVRELVRFSKWIWLNSALNFVNLRAADFFIGRIAGARALGTYSLGYEIANLPTSEMAAPLSRAVFPGYALVSGDAEAMRSTFRSTVGVLALAAVPAGLGISATALQIVTVVLGDAWLDAVPVMELVAIAGIFVALASNASYVCLAVGRPRLITLLVALHSIVLLPALGLLVPSHGAIGAAIAVFGAAAVWTPAALATAARVAGLDVVDAAGVLVRPLIAGAAMYFAVRQVGALFASPGILALASMIVSGIAVYLTVLLGLWWALRRPEGAEAAILRRLGTVVPAATPNAAADDGQRGRGTPE
jgi:O-antigen/teichoic acid export membrane protein